MNVDPTSEDMTQLQQLSAQNASNSQGVNPNMPIANLGTLMQVAPGVVKAMEQSIVLQFCMQETEWQQQQEEERKEEYGDS